MLTMGVLLSLVLSFPKRSRDSALSKKTGETYCLPTEWEWEWAATGFQKQQYPWGEQFDKDKCNTEEATIIETTPVGSYLDGINQSSPVDMIGNAWEITQGSTPSSSLVAIEVIVSITSLLTGVAIEVLKLLIVIDLLSIIEVSLIILSSILVILGIATIDVMEVGSFTGVLRGGAFDTPSNKATCFFRKGYEEAANNVGFRCVKEL